MVFCGAVCLAGAWFSYLKLDGLVIFRKPLFSLRRFRAGETENRIDRMMGVRPREERPPGTAPKDSVQLSILSNIISGVILIAVSFVF